MNLLGKILCMVLGYAFGGYLTATTVAKKYAKKDISEIGTGNPGMANVMAQLGKKPGFIVLAGDILKTVIAMAIAAIIWNDEIGYHMAFLWTGFGALLGHNFPVMRKFKGGKGVTVTCTWIILLLPFSGILSAVAGGLVVLLTGLLPLGAVLITFFVLPFAYFELGIEGFLVMLASFLIMLMRHFPGFIRGFKNEEKREFKKDRSVKSIVLTIVIIILVYVIGFGRYFLLADWERTSAEEIPVVENDLTTAKVEIEEEATPKAAEDESYNYILSFAGDINFDENWCSTQYMDSCENGIYDCISPELVDVMNEADIMWINNEFTYSNGGEALEGKAYTFRANPRRVEILKALGVDIVGLANNHVYDYGKTALLDTLDTLDSACIPYVGAGRNIEEAMEPYYFELDGIKIAYVAASRAEKIKMTPQATEDEPGILRCYDTELFKQAIVTAKENADFVIALPHWGTEYSTTLDQVQIDTAREYIDAGADAIIGAHTHCLQGFEYYNGKPIVYSLGNYWFNEKTLDTMIVNLNIYNDERGQGVNLFITPAIQKDKTTTYLKEESDRQRLFETLEEMSINVDIDEKGNVTDML